MSTIENKNLCISASKGLKWQDVQLSPCSAANENVWRMDRTGKIKNERFKQHCLAPSSVTNGQYKQLRLLHCWKNPRVKSWFFTSQGQIRYAGSSKFINIREQLPTEPVQMSYIDKASNKSKWIKVPLSEYKTLT
jgi:hypothetical protein